jgi:hypothetical protein
MALDGALGADQAEGLVAGGVVADQADQGRLAAQRRDIARGVAAPPSMTSSPLRASTGTGASGEMRPTSPKTKRSTMTSPMQAMRTPGRRASRA